MNLSGLTSEMGYLTDVEYLLFVDSSESDQTGEPADDMETADEKSQTGCENA